MTTHDITGIVLSGGRSSRMRQNKSLMLFNGKPLIQHAIDTLLTVCGKVVISSNDPAYEFTGSEVWPDELPARAAMIGLYSCLKRSQTDWNIVMPCDMPRVEPRLLPFLLEQIPGYEVVIPVHHGSCIEPLCGLYNRSVLPGLEQRISIPQYSMQEFVGSTRCRLVYIDNRQDFFHERMFTNINTPGDFIHLNANMSG
jgi:molybdopterin-guanine dinucleotide biosynthesis protein A